MDLERNKDEMYCSGSMNLKVEIKLTHMYNIYQCSLLTIALISLTEYYL